MRVVFKRRKPLFLSQGRKGEWAAGQRGRERGTLMEGKGGHACPSHWSHEVIKVIFPEVR